ncbi:MAG: T9SS type A sorting domain-containing protein [Calditrichaeota bacterium]|nr:T9SS type A sorting domain-containing protein [Calditrichota bacterium]
MNKTLFLLVIPLVLSVNFKTALSQMGSVAQSFSSPGSKPTGLAWDGTNLWNADTDLNRIFKIDPKTGSVLSSIPAPPGSVINGLTWDGEQLWCTDRALDKIYAIDKNTGAVLKTFTLNYGSPRGITFDGKALWYVDSGENKIFKIDPQTGKILKEMTAPSGYNRGLTWDGKYLWSTDKDKDEIYIIDTLRNSVVQILPAPGSFPYGLAFDGEHLWNADYDTDTIYKINIKGNELFYLSDPLRARIRYSVKISNTGSSDMDLKTYLACPMNLSYQNLDDSLQFMEIPESYFTDRYGQKIAFYHTLLSPGASIVYGYSVAVTLQNIRYRIHPDSVGKLSEIPDSIIAFYTQDGEKYKITHPVIVNAVKQALGDETNFYWKVRKIHDYVIGHIDYLAEGSWDDAPTVLKNGYGSCSEYTFVFVAMCRAAGIPARFEAGSHLRDAIPYRDRIFHRWQQVYFPDIGWVPVDCNWDDKKYPANQARYFGAGSNQTFTTTIGAGGDEGLWWTYNSANSNSGGIRDREKIMEWLPYTTGIQTKTIVYPNDFITASNYPNPFNSRTVIEYRLKKPSRFSIHIYNSLGQLIKKIDVDNGQKRGKILWDARNRNGKEVNTGTYYYRIETAKQYFSGKMILQK